jgi:non-ribosomal peptide synthetase component F
VRQFRTTSSVFFLAAYAVVLQSYTRKPRLGLWSHFSNRGRAEIQNTVGYFVHTHLLGIDFSSNPTGAELLEQVRQTVLDAYEHQEMPLSHLWHHLKCWPRYADARVLVDYNHAEEVPERQSQSRSLAIRRAKQPGLLQGRFSSLGVYIRSSADGLTLSVQYDQARFPQAAIQPLVQDLHTVMARLLVDPHRKAMGLLGNHRYPASSVHSSAHMGEFVRLATDLTASWCPPEPKLTAVTDKPSI